MRPQTRWLTLSACGAVLLCGGAVRVVAQAVRAARASARGTAPADFAAA